MNSRTANQNIAFIDAQNLHLGLPYAIDHTRFRVYLSDKFRVQTAYYFLGYRSGENQSLYQTLEKAGFELIFREHESQYLSIKKGNVDTDIVFAMMKSFIENQALSKIILVSGDGDYKRTVDYLIQNDRFEKILFPNQKKASSLYKKLGNQFQVNLNQPAIIKKIKYQKEKGG